ncbi:MAG: alpha/beta hydrolase [Deltaproteobacteria bacterium]|nr:alpha/beta hydrolase [Deltaproteobacteria bacterium]
MWLLLLVGCSGGADTSSGSPSDWGEVLQTQIQVGELLFDARAAGPHDGELVILLHGFPETSYEWRAQLSALGEAGYRAVAPDQRGYSPGARPASVMAYEISLLVRDVLDMADQIGAPHFHVVGHDWGAVVAWALAALAPERIITLTAVSIPHPDAFAEALADPESCQRQASAYFDFFVSPASEAVLLDNDAAGLRGLYAELSDDAVDEYLRVLGTEDALGAALNWYRANIGGRQIMAEPVGPIAVPTLFVWSDGDAAVCREGAEATERFVAAPYRFEILEGVSHWVPELASDAVNRFLIEHLAQ